MDLELNALPCTDLAGWDGVETGLEGDKAVLANSPQVLVGDQIRQLRQRQQRGPVDLGTYRDDLPVGAVDLGATDRQPPGERPVHFRDRVEAAASDDMVTDDEHLPFDPALACGPGRQPQPTRRW